MITGSTSDTAARRFVQALHQACGDQLVAVLFHGSRLLAAEPDQHSAYDLVLVVRAYGPFYRALREASHIRRSPLLLAALNRWLPPNVVSFCPEPPEGPLAKCLVLSRSDFARSLTTRSRDHFCLGRLVQRVELLYAHDEAVRRFVTDALARARRTTLAWVTPFLPHPFTVEDFCRRMLAISYSTEIRPESIDRVQAVLEAQSAHLLPTFEALLEEVTDSGLLARDGKGYRPAEPPGAWDRVRWRAYFLRSKLRATARWSKHMLTFEDWLDYIVQKVARRTGLGVQITPWERRIPIVLLWPKLVRVLRARKGTPPSRYRPARPPASDEPDS
jgi:hypothetical protein